MGQQNKKRLKELKQKYDKMVAGELNVYDGRGKGVDVYVCHKCGKKLYTRYKDKGVTPLCIRHKCGGIMMHEYTISEEEAKAAGAKVFNWVRPSWRFVRRNPACWEHIMGGGLNLVD